MAPLVPSLLAEAGRTFAAQAEGMGVSVRTFDGHPLSGRSFDCDPPRIRGALYNFASNALKWSRPHEKIVTRLRDRVGRANGADAGTGMGNPVVVLGASELPPHLWTHVEWRTAWSGLGSELCGKLHRIVCDRDEAASMFDGRMQNVSAGGRAVPSVDAGDRSSSRHGLFG